MKALQLATIIVIFIAFVFAIVSAFTPGWAQFPLLSRGRPVTYGFFQACLSGTCRTSRVLTGDDATRASAAFMIISALLTLIGWITTTVGVAKGSLGGLKIGGIITIIAGLLPLLIRLTVYLTVKKERSSWQRKIIFLPTRLGICAIIGGAIFAGSTVDFAPVLGYSFALAWVAAVLALIGGSLAVILAKQ